MFLLRRQSLQSLKISTQSAIKNGWQETRFNLRVAHTCTINLGQNFKLSLSFNSLKYKNPRYTLLQRKDYVVCEHFFWIFEVFCYQLDLIENFGHSKNAVSLTPFYSYMLALCSYRLILLLVMCKTFQSYIVLGLGQHFCDNFVIFRA